MSPFVQEIIKLLKSEIRVSPQFFRPTEVETLLGDAAKAKRELGWEPHITFDKLVEEMALSDLAKAESERHRM